MMKTDRLLQLAHQRQATRWPGYGCIGDYHGGAYECDFVSPYTRSAGNVDATVMILLQDWASDQFLRGLLRADLQSLGYAPELVTNRQLIALLRRHLGLSLGQTYATNLFPFIKYGPMSAPIAAPDLVRAAREYGLPQIAIVQPRLAICLGKSAFNALRRAAGLRPLPTLDEAIASPFAWGQTQIWCQAHTGRLGTNNRNRGGVDRVHNDWQAMARTCHAHLRADNQSVVGPR